MGLLLRHVVIVMRRAKQHRPAKQIWGVGGLALCVNPSHLWILVERITLEGVTVGDNCHL